MATARGKRNDAANDCTKGWMMMEKVMRRYLALVMCVLLICAYGPSINAKGEPIEEGVTFYDYEISVIINPEAGGTVPGDGPYNDGDRVNVMAINNTGHLAFTAQLTDFLAGNVSL